MMKKMLLLFGICLLYTGFRALGQAYNIQSLDGRKTVIQLYYEPSSGMLQISCLKDTLIIDDFMSIDTVSVFKNTFLEIKYAKRAGTNEDRVNLLLLCICKGRLCQAFHVNSLLINDMRNVFHEKNNPDEYALFEVKIKVTGTDSNTMKAKVSIHNESHSNIKPKNDHNYNKTTVLSFDKQNCVFYNNYETLNGTFQLHTLVTINGKKQFIRSKIPVITIDSDKYYYLNRDWYIKEGNHFYSMSL